jgi:Conjugative transposon protein TcpC
MLGLNKAWERRLDSTRASAGRVGQWAILGLAALAGLHVVWNFLFSSPPDVVTPTRALINQSAAVSSFAQDYVSVWLTATSTNPGSLAQFVSLKNNDLQLPSTPAVVIDAPTVVSVTYGGQAGRDAGGAVFSVVVGVTQRPYESAAPTRALYVVPVLWSKYGVRAISLPARIADRGLGADAEVGYSDQVGEKDPVFAVVSGFINAYLTKAGGLDRYVTADSNLVSIGDAYQSATVRMLLASATPSASPRDGEMLRVLAKVTAITSQYAPTELVYPLTLTGVGGRWTVVDVDRAPVMSTMKDLVPVVTSSVSK